MRRFLLLFHVFFAFSHSFPVRNDDRGVLPNIDALFCTNKDLRQVVFNALQNITNPKAIAVDQVQAAIQVSFFLFFSPKKFEKHFLIYFLTNFRVLANFCVKPNNFSVKFHSFGISFGLGLQLG